MNFYSSLKAQIRETELNKKLNALYNLYLVNGITIPSNGLKKGIDLSIINDPNLIKYNSIEDQWHIQPSNLFAYCILKTKIPDFEENLPVDLASLNAIYEKAVERPEDSFSTGLMYLHNRILELLLRITHENTGHDFSEWIPQLSNDLFYKIKFEFLQAYCEIANELRLPGKTIINASRYFLSWQDMASEMHVGKLLMQYGATNCDEVSALLNSLSNGDISIKSSLIGGLLSSNATKGLELAEELFLLSENQAFIMTALSRLQLADVEVGWRALNLLITYNRANESNRFCMPSSLTRLVDKVEFDDCSFVQKCYKELNELAQIEHLLTAKYVLDALKFAVKKHPEPTVRILLTLLDNPIVTHEHIGKLNFHPSFDDVLHYVEDVDLQFNFLITYARHYVMLFKHDTFYSTINTSYMRPSTKAAFQEKVLECLVHDEGAIRLFGNQLLDFFSHYGHKFDFHTDIAQLSPITQYKLLLSILLLYRQPKNTVPLILPLLESCEPIISEALICKLEELTECYHEEVIRAVEYYERQKEPIDATVAYALTRIKSHYHDFCQRIDKKRAILELNSFITQTAILNRFNEIHRHKMNEQMNTVMEERGGIISMFKKVTLAKGGGWKHKQRDEISKLGHFQSSFTWPRFHLINPEFFDLEHRINRAANWHSDKTDFIEWITE